MLQSQQIYAPDPSKIWSDGGISLGRRLFKLLPEDAFDRGPALSQDGRRVVVGDVRLDNREEIAAEIGVSKEQERRLSDTALILAALEKWEEAALPRLIGDFAFASWDVRKRRLLLARDYLGTRPLHYHAGPDFFAFASMPKGLHALAEVRREPDVDAITRFLALLPEINEQSYFVGVKRVPPAHFCSVTADGLTTHRYWDYERKELRLSNPKEYHAAVRESLERAVTARLRGSDGRVATHLSSGLDSSTVTATAARLLASRGRITAFTSVPREGYSGQVPGGRFADEGPAAAALARLYPQVEHVLVRTGDRSPAANLDKNFFLFERPLLNLCNGVWANAINDEARARGLRVLLVGQFGNMSFSYSGLQLLPELLAQGRMIALSKHIKRLPSHGISRKAALAMAFGSFLPKPLWRALSRARGRDLSVSSFSAIEPGAGARMQSEAEQSGLDMNFRPRRDPFGTRTRVLKRVDVGNYQKGSLAGWGLDVRDPTADRRLIELCLSIPPEQFLVDGEPRALARAAFADRLPPEILQEKRSGLQASDWHEGFAAARDEIAEEVERFASIEATGEAIDNEMLKRLLSDIPDGDWNSSKVSSLYRLALLRGVSAGHFVRKATGSNA